MNESVSQHENSISRGGGVICFLFFFVLSFLLFFFGEVGLSKRILISQRFL